MNRSFATLAAHRNVWMLAVPLFVLAEMLLYGHRIGLHNHAIQLPYLFWLNDRSLYPNDRFMLAMHDYFSYFWVAVAWLARWIPLTPLFLTIHLLTLAGRYAAVWAIVRRVAPGDAIAPWIACWIHLFAETPIGREALHWFYVAQTPVASVAGLWAIWLALSGRWKSAFALAGFVFNLHAMQSAYLGMMIGAAWAWAHRVDLFCRKNLSSGAVCLALFLACAAPGLVWMMRGGAIGSSADLGELLRAFFPGHFFPSAFTAGNWIALVGYTLLFAGAWRLTAAPRERAAIGASIVALFVFWIVAGVLIETMEPGILLKLHVYRSSSYFVVLGIVLCGVGFARALRWLAERRRSALLPFIALLIAGPVILTKPRPEVLVPVAIIVSCALAVWFAGDLISRKRCALLAGIPAAAILFCGFGYQGVRQHRERIQWNAVFEWHQYKLQQAAIWAREHTPPDAKFLTPPNHAGFRIGSRRSVVFEWVDGAAMLWDADYCAYWRAHYLQTGATLEDQYPEFIAERVKWPWFAKPREEIEAIARREGAQYIVFFRDDRLPGKERVLPWSGRDIVYDDGELFFIARVPDE